MNKPNYLYGIIGLLTGLIVGYIGTNYINQTNHPAATAGDTEECAAWEVKGDVRETHDVLAAQAVQHKLFAQSAY